MTEHDLKEMKNLGAELGAAKAENEKLRGLLRTAWRLRPDHDYHDEHMQAEQKAWEVETAEVLNAADALSQHAEPTDTFTAVDMATAAAQGFRDGQAAVEPAPAQDEPQSLNAWFLSLEPGRQAVLREDKWMLANAAFEAGRATRPAQTEQQPIYLYRRKGQDAFATCDEDRFEELSTHHLFETKLAYAAPIAQPAPQPEQSGLVEAAGAVIRAADWWSANEDSPKSALAHFVRAADALRAALSAQGAGEQ